MTKFKTKYTNVDSKIACFRDSLKSEIAELNEILDFADENIRHEVMTDILLLKQILKRFELYFGEE